MESSGDRGKIFKADSDMVRLFLKDASPLVLREVPPGRRLSDGDKSRSRGQRPIQRLLALL